jgi:hypothetical protein
MNTKRLDIWLIVAGILLLMAVLFTEPPPCEPCDCERRSIYVSAKINH